MLLKGKGRSITKSMFAYRSSKRTYGVAMLIVAIVLIVGFILAKNPAAKIKAKGSLFEISTFLVSLFDTPLGLVTDTSGFIDNLKLARDHAELIGRLKWQNQSLLREKEALHFRIRDLESILSVKSIDDQQVVTAPCFGQNSCHRTGYIYIHAGSDQGVKRHQPVKINNTLIGLTDAVGPYTTKVMLVSHDRSRIPVISEIHNQEGVLGKNNAGDLIVHFVGHPDKFIVGEPIFTSGTDGMLPRGLLAGYVKSIKDGRVEVKLAQSFEDIIFAQIATRYQPDVTAGVMAGSALTVPVSEGETP